MGGRRQSTRDSFTRRTDCNGSLHQANFWSSSTWFSDAEEGQRRADLPQRLLRERVARDAGVEPVTGGGGGALGLVGVLVGPGDAAEVDRPVLLVGVDDDVAHLRLGHEADEDAGPGGDRAAALVRVGGRELALSASRSSARSLTSRAIASQPSATKPSSTKSISGSVVVDAPPAGTGANFRGSRLTIRHGRDAGAGDRGRRGHRGVPGRQPRGRRVRASRWPASGGGRCARSRCGGRTSCCST